MLVKFAKESYTIAAGTAVSGQLQRPQSLHISGGRVWLTIAGDAADHWLSAGEVFILPAKRLIVIEAEQEASHIQLCPERYRHAVTSAAELSQATRTADQKTGKICPA
ncbi:hypothetical protein BH11PSE12_BH11PSE12_31330 [soil metagenome]